MSRRYLILLTLLALLLPFAAGCWDQDEIEELAIVRTIAVDYLPDRRAPYVVTLGVKRPAALGAQDGGGGQGEPTVLYTGVGASIDLAIQQASFSISRRVFLAHTELIIVGDEMAREGIQPVLDFVVRSPEVRISAFLLIAKGTAYEVLSTPERLEGTVSDEILGLIRQANETSEAEPREVFQFLREMATPGQDPHTAVITVQPLLKDIIPELKPEQQAGGEGENGGGGGGGGGGGDGGGDGGGGGEQPKTLAIDGMAVFRGDKLAGVLNHIEARGFLWLTGGTTRGLIAVDDPVHPDEVVNLFLARSQTSVTPVVENGRISYRVEIEAEGDIASQASQAELTTSEMLQKLNSAKAGAIKVEIEKAMRRLQELETDVVGFGAMLNRKDSKAFRGVADRWPEVFRDITLDIHVKANVRRTGQHDHPTRITR